MADGHLLGCARVSTAGQDASGQIDALNAAGRARVFVEHASGAKAERVELAKLLAQVLPGAVVCVVRYRPDKTPEQADTIQAIRELG